jgi:uncharacterized protein (TIGR03437 family)
MPTQSKIDIERPACSPVRPTLKRLALALTIFASPAICQAQSHPITAKASPSITSGGVVSASAFGGFASVAPGSWIEIYGSNLASESGGWSASDFTGVNAPTLLDGTSVTIGGKSAFVDYVSPSQVNAQVPSNVATGPQPVIVTAGGVASNPVTATVNAEEPGLLAPSSFNIGGNQYVVALFSDGTTYVLPPGAIAGVPSRRAQPGDTITLYGVGVGPVIPNIPAGQIVQQANALALPFQFRFGQTQATVTYAGLAPSEVGLYQFDVTVPTIASSDLVPVTFTLGGVAGTQTLYISIQGGNTGPQVQSLTLSTSVVAGGGTVQGTVVLSEPAPAGGAIVALSSNSSAATLPSTVTVPAAATSANFTVSTGSVSSYQAATITATYSGSSAQATLTVTQATANSFPSSIVSLNDLAADFFPVGYPSAQLVLLVNANPTLNPDNVTYTAGVGGLQFLNGVFSNQNQTFTFTNLQSGSYSFPEGPDLSLSSASLTFTLTINPAVSGNGYAFGSFTGTLSFAGTPLIGGASVTVSGPFMGTYSARANCDGFSTGVCAPQ